MKELIKYLIIRCTTRHAKTAIEIYNNIYSNKKDADIVYIEKPNNKNNSMSVSTVSKNSSKKDEIIESLEYLKSKKTKTKQDKDSIYTLEMVLKNL